MNCEQCRRWWSPYLDSELDAGTTFEVSEHLRTCRACRDRFEREAYVDDWMRTKLKEMQMPTELWGAIRADVRRKPQLIKFPLVRPLAAAACIALVALGGIYYIRSTGPEPQRPPAIAATMPSMADLLQQAAPQLAAFEPTPQADPAARLLAISRRILDATVSIDYAAAGGHPLELIEVTERTDSTGKNYLELRLNCCGRPVLLALSRTGGNRGITELCRETDRCRTPSHPNCPNPCEIESQSVAHSGVMIAAATADHSLATVLKVLRIERI